MENKKYKVLVLSDLKTPSEVILRSSVSLSKIIGGEVCLLHVERPTEIISQDNQLSAMRSIKEKYLKVDKQIKDLVNPIEKEFNVNINYKSSFGNLKTEIENYIKNYNPDVIVLGKKKNKALKFVGDKLIKLVLKNHNGAVMIASHENELLPNKKLSLGILNNTIQTLNTTFSDLLITNSEQPIKLFKINEDNNPNKLGEISKDNKTIEYVFDKNTNDLDNVSKYALQNNVNLMFVNNNKTLKNVINKVNTSLLFSSEVQLKS